MRLLASRVGQAGRILSPVAWIARLSRSNRWLGASRARRAAKHRSCRFHEERTVELEAPPQGAPFKGYTDYVVQDLMIRPHVVNFRCERLLSSRTRSWRVRLPAFYGRESCRCGCPVRSSQIRCRPRRPPSANAPTPAPKDVGCLKGTMYGPSRPGGTVACAGLSSIATDNCLAATRQAYCHRGPGACVSVCPPFPGARVAGVGAR